jgi:BirA family biotin operon repressor/biotin-[acetyl-CoA-carboxylase] ligase
MSPADAADRLNRDELAAALRGQRIGNHLVVLEETTSTNDVIAQLAPDHREGVVVFAERQTAGRGQYGRRWDSAAHRGLWLSVLLRPRIAVADSSKLTDLLAQTIAATLREFASLQASIKLPNDVYIDGRKVAGVPRRDASGVGRKLLRDRGHGHQRKPRRR